METVIKLNALDKNSSGSFSRTIKVETVEDFQREEREFEQDIPFSRYYFDHEFLSGDENLIDLDSF
jgi:hypothetical protein